ncbi:MAG: CHRD domain-containing protein [Ignavibacteria bacterium]
MSSWFSLLLFSLLFISQSFSQIMFTAKLDGSQEAPNPVSTPATGTAWAVLGPDMTTLTFHLTYAQLDSTFTNAHFHLGAAGVGGGVIHGIASDFVGNTASGVWTDIPDSILTKLFKQEIYLNIHSAKHPGGEIRGQLIPVEDGLGFTAALDGNQETPAVSTPATGTGWAVLRDDGSEIEYSVTVAGLSSNITAAHFHNAPAGESKPPIQPITFTDSTSTGSWTGFADSIISQILFDNLYFNVHTTNHGGGEIRGQLIHQGEIMFNAKLEGNNVEPNPVTTDGKGTLWAVLSGDKSTLYYRVTYAQLDSTFTNAHFHLGAEGVGGGVIHGIASDFVGNTASGQWTGFADSILAKLIKEEIYINIHSAKYPGGEIRDQLHNVDGIGFTASLDGTQETPAVTTNSTGTGWAVMKDSGTNIEHNITISGLSSNLTAAHYHNAAAGASAPPLQAITFTDSSSSGTWTGFAENVISELLKNRLYFNVHSSDHASGEIRGQIEFSNIVSGNIPVELTSFSAYINEKNVLLNWTTATETNNLGFEIEKQIGNAWLKIGFVKGNGTSSELHSYSFTEKNVGTGKYSYRLKQIDFDGSFEYSNVISINIGTPLSFRMSQNYPNPFNPSTIINFQIPEKTNVSLKVYDILGREVMTLLNEVKEPGIYNINFNAAGFSSGVYIYKLSTGNGNVSVKKMTLIK